MCNVLEAKDIIFKSLLDSLQWENAHRPFCSKKHLMGSLALGPPFSNSSNLNWLRGLAAEVGELLTGSVEMPWFAYEKVLERGPWNSRGLFLLVFSLCPCCVFMCVCVRLMVIRAVNSF